MSPPPRLLTLILAAAGAGLAEVLRPAARRLMAA